ARGPRSRGQRDRPEARRARRRSGRRRPRPPRRPEPPGGSPLRPAVRARGAGRDGARRDVGRQRPGGVRHTDRATAGRRGDRPGRGVLAVGRAPPPAPRGAEGVHQVTAALVLMALAAAGGATLVLADVPWFRRPSLTERLRPFTPAGGRRRT